MSITINDFPIEIITHILNFVGPLHLQKCKTVSKFWKSVIDSLKTCDIYNRSFLLPHPFEYNLVDNLLYLPLGNTLDILDLTKIESCPLKFSTVFEGGESPIKVYPVDNKFIGYYHYGVVLFDSDFRIIRSDHEIYNVFEDDPEVEEGPFLQLSYFDYNRKHFYAFDNYGSLYIWDHELNFIYGAGGYQNILDPECVFAMTVDNDKISIFNYFNNPIIIPSPFTKIPVKSFWGVNYNKGCDRITNPNNIKFKLTGNILNVKSSDGLYVPYMELNNHFDHFAASETFIMFLNSFEHMSEDGKNYIYIYGIENKMLLKKIEYEPTDELYNISICELKEGYPTIIINAGNSKEKVMVWSWK